MVVGGCLRGFVGWRVGCSGGRGVVVVVGVWYGLRGIVVEEGERGL